MLLFISLSLPKFRRFSSYFIGKENKNAIKNKPSNIAIQAIGETFAIKAVPASEIRVPIIYDIKTINPLLIASPIG